MPCGGVAERLLRFQVGDKRRGDGNKLLVFCKVHGLIAVLGARPVPYSIKCLACGGVAKRVKLRSHWNGNWRMLNPMVVAYEHTEIAIKLVDYWTDRVHEVKT
jgi:hypothetical protein